MDARVERVIRDFQARADAESGLLDEGRSVDDLLLPIGRAAATFVNLLIKEANAQSILEVGTSYGYSTVWLAEAARETGGIVTTLELHPYKAEHARSEIARAGLADHVDFRLGDALETIEALPGPFEFVLLDLWKNLYVKSFDAIYPKLADGALIVADNMLYPPRSQPDANAYREHVRSAPEMTSVLLPIGSGLEISRYR